MSTNLPYQKIESNRAALIKALGWLPHAMDDEQGVKMVIQQAEFLRDELPKLREQIQVLQSEAWESSNDAKKLRRDCIKAETAHYQRQCRIAIRMAFQQACKPEDDYRLNWFSRQVWYPIKLLICIWLQLHPQEEKHGKWYCREGIDVATLHYSPTYAGWECDWVEVGRGVFRNWWFQIEHDSEWNM